MEVEHILRDFGIILGAGLVSQLIATFLRIPEMIVLVAVGALIGPSMLGIVENPLNGAGAQLIFTLGVSLILFHGGVGISLRLISRVAVGLGLLALPGVLITTVIVALAVAPIFGVAFPVALLIGAVLASTDPAILIPLFDRLNIRPKVAQTLISESGFNDTTGDSNETNLELFGEVHDLLSGSPYPEVAFCYRASHILDVLCLLVEDPPCLLLHPSRFDVQRS